jgi:hypothetical protein
MRGLSIKEEMQLCFADEESLDPQVWMPGQAA